MKRRTFVVAGLATAAGSRAALAGPSADDRRRQNRLELWHNYAHRTSNLVARLTTTRETSLLDEPLTVTGTLLFLAPATVMLRDDGLSGSTTLMTPEGTRVFGNGDEPPAALPPGGEPAVDWLVDRFVRAFAPAETPEALVDAARVHVPRGRGYRLELLPPKGSTIRRRIRSFAIELDPVAGAITQLTIAEAQGDRVVMGLADHRQNLAPEDLEPVVAPVRDYLPSLRE